MLIALNIQNFALIEQADLSFHPGFTVITGETGSGKSILLGALNLILGERADYGVIRDKEEKTVVEATFRITGFGLESFFNDNDLDFLNETVVRREITAQGRSRAFINDTPVQLNVLKDLSERLVHIHSQHHTLELKNPLFQLDLLDILADNVTLRQEYKKDYLALRQLNAQLQEKKSELAKMLQDSDYNRFQWEELDALKLQATNYADLETELQSYEKIDDVKAGFASIVQAVADDRGTVDVLSLLKSSLEKVHHLHPALSVLSERIVTTLVELKDIAADAEQQLDSLESNPERQAELTERMDLFNRVLRKHQAHDQADLLTIYEALAQSQSGSDSLEVAIEEMEKALKALHGRVQTLATQLHENRVAEAPAIAASLMEVLNELKLVQTQITFELEKAQKLDETGMTKLVLLFAPNAGLSPKPIEKAASGGELSRFMLALQLLLSAKKQLPTLLFDEIDTGVSGEVAQKIGQVLQKMGAGMQVLAITHLPQVAAKGTNHWKVAKSNRQGQTITEVITLNENERVEEIARLMSGENINEAAILNARALMN